MKLTDVKFNPMSARPKYKAMNNLACTLERLYWPYDRFLFDGAEIGMYVKLMPIYERFERMKNETLGR